MKTLTYNHIIILLAIAFILTGAQTTAQEQQATLVLTSESVIEVPSIASQIENGTFIPAENILKEYNPKRWGKNTSVPGKGLPKGDDPLWDKQSRAVMSTDKAPILTFEAASSGSTPTDPTGAVGPNHFLNSWNSAFSIWDKAGNPLTSAASLSTIFPGTLGDPIVMYDPYADRFFISEFFNDGFDVAISKGPDPVNDGWWVYRFATNTFPDYPKFSVWSDAYYITANKDQNTPTTSEVVFALERDSMLVGSQNAQMIGFSLSGIVTNGFYSPLGFNCNGATLPPAGDAPIVYMQDDSWAGVSTDHLKIWTIDVDWATPANSTISSPQIINTTPFDGLFDGGSFSNLPQPSGGDIDALQATVMYMAQYRRFPTYNTVVFNFVVDLDGNDDYSGIRWYELRQANDGDPWSIYQEGTYAQPDGHSAFSGNMCMDVSGNIALAYTCVSSTLYPSLRYTGRFAGDALGTMTIAEEVIANGTQSDPSTRYGDYSQMTIDPTDDVTFWSIGEYFTGGTRKNHVGVFQFAAPALTAGFSANDTNICAGGSVTFTDQSIGSPTIWNWSFPGGSPGSYSGQNPPAIAYSSSGQYNVTLIVSDSSTTDTTIKVNYISVNPVIADFSGTPTTLVVGDSVMFTDNSSCSPTSWNWTFSGGTPGSYIGQSPPAIIYNSAGTYDVKLTVSNASANDSITKTGYIYVTNCNYCTPAYTTGTSGGDYISLVQLGTINNATGASSSPYYTFYDTLSTNLTIGNPDSITLSAGTYINSNNISVWIDYDQSCTFDTTEKLGNVTLGAMPETGTIHFAVPQGTALGSTRMRVREVWDNPTMDPCDSYSYGEAEDYTVNIIPNTSPPDADFSADDTNPALLQTVSFADLSTNFPTSWAWSITPPNFNFIGGTNGASQNPQVQFCP